MPYINVVGKLGLKIVPVSVYNKRVPVKIKNSKQ